MRFTSPSESGVSQKTCESGMSIGPNLCAFAEADDEEVLMAAEADVASALEDAARDASSTGIDRAGTGGAEELRRAHVDAAKV